MGDKNLSVFFVDDPREWFCKKEVRDCINWRRDFYYTFLDLHMKDHTRSYGSSLYTFNAADFPKEKNGEKFCVTFIISAISYSKMLYQSLLLIFFTTKGLVMV